MTPGLYSLGDLAITKAGTFTLDPVTGLGGLAHASMHVRFAYGSGGVSVQAYVQTSLDQGVTWIDIAALAFATAGATRVLAVDGGVIATPLTPGDGVLPDNTAVNNGVAPLGDRLRLKVAVTGTYAGSTVLSARVAVR